MAAVLSAWGYNTTTLLAGLGIGGVALALASQKTIENLFGSVAVISDRPVSVGDFCKFGRQHAEPWKTSGCAPPEFARSIGRW